MTEFKQVMAKLSPDDQKIIDDKINMLLDKAFSKGMRKGFEQAKKKYRGESPCTNT